KAAHWRSLPPITDLSCSLYCRPARWFVLHLFASHHGTELLGRLEDRYRPRGHLHRLTGSGVPGHPGLTVADLEGAEAAHLDVFLILRRFLDRVQERVDRARAVLL